MVAIQEGGIVGEGMSRKMNTYRIYVENGWIEVGGMDISVSNQSDAKILVEKINHKESTIKKSLFCLKCGGADLSDGVFSYEGYACQCKIEPEPTELEKAAQEYATEEFAGYSPNLELGFIDGAKWLAARLSDELIGMTEMGAEPTRETWGVAKALRKSILELTKMRE